MLIKNYYVPLQEKELKPLLLSHICAKYEHMKGILFIEKDKRLQHFGILNKTVLVKSLEYYSKQEGVKVTWCYGAEAKKLATD